MPETRKLPEGVAQGSYAIRADVGSSTLDIDVTGFIGWWPDAKQDVIRRVRDAKPDTIRLFVSSPGGFVDDAFAIHDFLSAYPARVETTIAGMTASAATVVALSGDSVRISDNALFLVHHASAGLLAFGKAEEIEEAADQLVRELGKVNGRLLNLYAKRTGMSDQDLDELLSLEEWLTPSEALAYGFVDEIYEPEPATAAATAHAATAAICAAIGLPTPPTTKQQTRTVMADKKNPSEEIKAPQAAATPTPQPAAAEPEAATAQVDERAQLAKMQAELEQLKAENKRMAEERRAKSLAELKEAFTGRVPGAAVSAIVEAADKATKGEDVDLVASLVAAAKAIPTMVQAGRIPVTAQDAETEKVVSDSVRKF